MSWSLAWHADLIGELRGLLAQYPLDETFIAHQMTALYWSGRPADALSLYRQTRDRLVDEQGTEPGPVLSELHQRILRRDPQLAVRLATRRPGHVSPLDTLPPDTVDFLGREDELALLTAESGDSPQVRVIEGMPGAGKTALAVQAARLAAEQYPDGMFYLSFRTYDRGGPALSSGEALHGLLTMLGVPATQIPDATGERAALWRAQLSRRRVVVILDDAASRDQVRPLLPVSGRCLILITARRRLPDLEGARVIALDVLPPDDAAALFRRIAGAGRGQDADELDRAVESCGGLPLAIQHAAARLARSQPGPGDHQDYLGNSGDLARLADLADELSPARLRSSVAPGPEVSSAFDLSYQALEPDHQRYFRRLGLSPCPAVSLQAAAALAGGTLAEAEKTLNALIDHHLLVRTPDGQFRLHDLIRGFAAMRAASDDPLPEQRQAAGRLIDFYLHSADQADRVLHPFRHRMPVSVTYPPVTGQALGTQEDAAGWLELEWRSILQVAQHAGRHEWKRKCADLTHVLAGFVEVRGYWEEAIAAHTLALQACRDLADPIRIAQASLELSVVSQQAGRHEVALTLAQDAVAAYRSLADRRGLAGALDQVGLINLRAARCREALAYFLEAKGLYGAASDGDAGDADAHGLANTLSHSGISCWQLGHCSDAIGYLGDALALYREVGDRRGEAKTLSNLGKTQLQCGYHRDALRSFRASLEIFSEIDGAQNQAIAHQNIGSVYRYKGSYEKALAAYRRALAIYRDIGDLPNEADVLNDIGAIYQSAECYEESLVHFEKAGSIAEHIGNLSEQVTALRGIADARRGSGRYGEAFDSYQSALRLAREIGDPYQEAKVLEGIAETTLSTQQPFAARIVFRQALDIFERLGMPEAESARIRIETTDPAFSLRTSLSA